VQGLKDALAGGKTLMTDDEAKAVIVALQTDLHKSRKRRCRQPESKQETRRCVFGGQQMKRGFVTLPSGLQYKILTAGYGSKAFGH